MGHLPRNVEFGCRSIFVESLFTAWSIKNSILYVKKISATENIGDNVGENIGENTGVADISS